MRKRRHRGSQSARKPEYRKIMNRKPSGTVAEAGVREAKRDTERGIP